MNALAIPVRTVVGLFDDRNEPPVLRGYQRKRSKSSCRI